MVDTVTRHRLARTPQSAQALFDVGVGAFRRGDESARAWLSRAVQAAPDEPALHFALAAGTPDAAAARRSLRCALVLDPGYALAWLELGWAKGKSAAALCRAYGIDGSDPNIATTVSAALLENGEVAAARFITAHLCRQHPQLAAAWINRGRVAVEDGDWAAGLIFAHRAVALTPETFEAWMNIGSIAGELMMGETAVRASERAVVLRPDSSQARWNRCLILLSEGDWKRGFADFEVRHEVQVTYPHRLTGRRWQGERLAGRLLIHDEIGYGDVFNFLRYIALAKDRVGSIGLEVKPGLGRLLGNFGGIERVLERSASPPPPDGYEAHVALESLPRLFGTTQATIPPPGVPLRPAEPLIQRWSDRLSLTARPRIGLCWAGNPKSAFDRQRSCRLGELASVLELDNVSFVSLQKGPAAAKGHPRLLDLDAELMDFADTAAVIANLDLVISVETSVAHLAGAMQVPLWVLLSQNPAWRWPRSGDSTKWYPSAKLIRLERQQRWLDLARAVAGALRDRFG